MANYPFSDRQTGWIKSHVQTLLTKRVELMELGFPLSKQQIIDATVPARWRNTFAEMRGAGIGSLNTTRELHAVVDFGYPVLMKMYLGNGRGDAVYYCFEQQMSMWNAKSYLEAFPSISHDAGSRLPFDLSTLNDEDTENLKAWVLKAGQERRFARLATKMVNEFFAQHCPSLYHMMARWPDLKLALIKLDGEWRSRIDEVPSRYKLRRWNWEISEEDWADKYQDAMDLTGEVLVSGEMLGTVNNTDPVPTTVEAWKVNEGWTFFN